MDDQTSNALAKAMDQAQVDDQISTDPLRFPSQVRIDDLKGASGSQMATTFANPGDAALVKRLKDLAKKREEISVCWRLFPNSVYF